MYGFFAYGIPFYGEPIDLAPIVPPTPPVPIATTAIGGGGQASRRRRLSSRDIQSLLQQRQADEGARQLATEERDANDIRALVMFLSNLP